MDVRKKVIILLLAIVFIVAAYLGNAIFSAMVKLGVALLAGGNLVLWAGYILRSTCSPPGVGHGRSAQSRG